MTRAIVHSIGTYLPEKIVNNEDLHQFPAGSADRIVQKTGVRSRRIAADEQCTSDLGAEAALDCLRRADFSPGHLNGLIVSTSSPDRMQPPTATRLQALIGAPQAFAFDINSVCAGSVYGMALADALIRCGAYENILLVAAEMYSRILYPTDFSTCPYFGDGAGAILFRRGNPGDGGILHSCLHTDGAKWDTVGVFGLGTMIPYARMTDDRPAYLKMNGRAVFEFAVTRGTEVILEILEQSGTSADQIKLFICHQANINIINQIAANTRLPRERFFVNLDRYGNTASASVIIALEEAMRSVPLSKGDKVLLAAFGGGLSWGASLIQL
jgi:3-oxoacyl-[acyl-carrier-protein] synthase-3